MGWMNDKLANLQRIRLLMERQGSVYFVSKSPDCE